MINFTGNHTKESGQASRLLLILAVVVLVAAIIVFLVIKMAEKPPSPVPTNTVVNQPIYEQTLGNIKFIFESARDHGDTLYARDAVKTNYRDGSNLTTTERFIEVKVGARNMGKVNMEKGSWDIQEIVDSEGREYVPLDGNYIRPWLPEDDLCGTLLKPAFNPTPCIKIYEVSREATGLKIRVVTGPDNSDDLKDAKAMKAEVDLIVTD
ncbi:MAG TPA: hypothetical protein PLF16_01670 [Candidatus Staskawiczbacteria bacterium]|nr:hypothetical protein [Candidatus Staskawiczbacteria bacterium]